MASLSHGLPLPLSFVSLSRGKCYKSFPLVLIVDQSKHFQCLFHSGLPVLRMPRTDPSKIPTLANSSQICILFMTLHTYSPYTHTVLTPFYLVTIDSSKIVKKLALSSFDTTK